MPLTTAIARFLAFALLLLYTLAAQAQLKIAVLDFELKDLTLLPHTPAELTRTASLQPLLADALKQKGYGIINISKHDQKEAQAGSGYLFDHTDSAAALAQKFGADYIIVGRLHKPSFLFIYLMARLIPVADDLPMREFITEIKGNDSRLTEKGIAALAKNIAKTLSP